MGRNLRPLSERKCIAATISFVLFAAWALVAMPHALADSPAPENAGAGGTDAGQAAPEKGEIEVGTVAADSDPTKPVLFSLRDEFFDLGGDLWRNVAMFRVDKAIFEKAGNPALGKGILMRADLPVVSFYNGRDTETGLGDLYGQVIIAPRISGPVFLAVGTGFLANTATANSLGSGKWVV